PVPEDQRPKLGTALKEGWSALLLPVVIFIPLLIDSLATDFLIARLGDDGAQAFSDAVLMFTPALAATYAIWVGRHNFSRGLTGIKELCGAFRVSLEAVVPISATSAFAYATSDVFSGMGVEAAVRDAFVAMNIPLWLLIMV